MTRRQLHLTAQGEQRTYSGSAVDLWALGAVVFEMLHVVPAFVKGGATLSPDAGGGSIHSADVGTAAEIEVRIRQGLMEDDLRRTLTPAARGMLQGMLTIDPEDRFTATDVLQHRWIRKRRSLPAAVRDAAHERSGGEGRVMKREPAGVPAVLQRRSHQVVADPLALYDYQDMSAAIAAVADEN